MTSNPENAMTEIALAMAIGFFSVMILTTLSRGVGKASSGKIATAAIIENAAQKGAGGVDRLAKEDVLVLFDGNRFLDRRLAPLDPARIAAAGRVVLAVDPGLSMERALAAKRRLARADAVVTTLNAEWRRALGRTRP
mgnify:CR=1 FL=1